MTLPFEELRALKMTREFMRDIAGGPRMPMKTLRGLAKSCLRHFPYDCVIDKMWHDRIAKED